MAHMVKHKALCLDLQNPQQKLSMVACVCNSSLQRKSGRSRQISEAHWPISLAELIIFRFCGRLFPTHKDGGPREMSQRAEAHTFKPKDFSLNPWRPGRRELTLTSCPLTSTCALWDLSIHTQINTYENKGW